MWRFPGLVSDKVYIIFVKKDFINLNSPPVKNITSPQTNMLKNWLYYSDINITTFCENGVYYIK